MKCWLEFYKYFVIALFSIFIVGLPSGFAGTTENLIVDGSFEQTIAKDQFGRVFKHWAGWKFDGDCEFRVGLMAHGGNTSSLLFAAGPCKIRIAQTVKAVAPGRYKLTAWIRGLDIAEGQYHQSTELAVDGKYTPLKKNGTFGWTPLTCVFDVKEKKDVAVSFGLFAPGYFWIDDVSLAAIGNDVAVSAQPVIGQEEKPIAPPAPLTAGAVRCQDCGFKNMAEWRKCYACGAELHGDAVASTTPPVKVIASFEEKSPFSGGTIVAEHATDGSKSLRIDSGYITLSGALDWSGYDYLKADIHTDSEKPMPLYLEMRDKLTQGYWTRVNHESLIAPGKSTLIIPLAQLYVGEKARPGRNLMLNAITYMALGIGAKPEAPIYVDNVRLERDTETPKAFFDGLHAFDFGPVSGPLMPGFTRIDPSTLYSKGRGYGLKDAQLWRAQDALQPDPLYQDFICIQRGGLAVDVPNGKYHVFVNIDNPSGFWGEYQTYRQRQVLAQGKVVVDESMTFEGLKKKYFRYWDTEDLARDNTFDKYQRNYYREKEFDVDVTDGQLKIDFRGDGFACSVSTVILYPADKAEQGKKFLDHVVAKRRFFFDNYFHRILHKGTGDPISPTASDTGQGYVVFTRGMMQDVYENDTPHRTEIGKPVIGSAFAGQSEPLTVSIAPLIDLGKVAVTISDLTGPGTIGADHVSPGYVSYRLTRVASDGAVYTITPRMIIPRNAVNVQKGVSRRFWLTVHTPDNAKPGLYHGTISLIPEHGQATQTPVEFRVYPGTLDATDIPVGPFGHDINIPWDGSDPAASDWNHSMAERSLRKLHEDGFTTFTGIPRMQYLGFKNGKPEFNFTEADRQMKIARACGFTMPVLSYTTFGGMDVYFRDEAAMKAAGFSDYSQFIKAVFTAIQQHADAAGWLPVYWNIADEPMGDTVIRAAENAEQYRAAFPKGPPFFAGATSFGSARADDPHFRFAKALHVATINLHNEESIKMLRDAGADWAFYNGGNRWTYGAYMYKAAKQFDMKFRVSWHWNVVAGDPYYALDCREDDYAWCNANGEGELIPSVTYEREFHAGLIDYRCMITLARLAREKHDAAAEKLIADRLATFKLGQREHDALFPTEDYQDFRQKVSDAIARLRGS